MKTKTATLAARFVGAAAAAATDLGLPFQSRPMDGTAAPDGPDWIDQIEIDIAGKWRVYPLRDIPREAEAFAVAEVRRLAT